MLSKLTRFHTRRADEARAFLGTKDYEVDFPEHDARRYLDLRVNGAYLPGTYVGYYQFGTPIVARTDAGRHDYWINMPLAEPIEATIGGETLIGDRKSGFIAPGALAPGCMCRSPKSGLTGSWRHFLVNQLPSRSYSQPRSI
jgi:hypothetical protein